MLRGVGCRSSTFREGLFVPIVKSKAVHYNVMASVLRKMILIFDL